MKMSGKKQKVPESGQGQYAGPRLFNCHDKLPEIMEQIRLMVAGLTYAVPFADPEPCVGRRMLVAWDPENVSADSAFINSLLDAIPTTFPQIVVDTISVVAPNPTGIGTDTKAARIVLRDRGAQGTSYLIDLPGGADANAADRRLSLEIIKWIRRNDPPAVILLITRDADFGPLMLRVSMQGFTTVNMTRTGEGQDAAQGLSYRVVFPSRKFENMNAQVPRRIRDPRLADPFMIPSEPRQIRRARTLFILDLDTYIFPSVITLFHAFQHFDRLLKTQLNNYDNMPPLTSQDFLVFGSNLPELKDRVGGMRYIQTSTYPRSKLIHMENLIISEFVDEAGYFQPAGNAIVIATRSPSYMEFLQWFSSQAFTVLSL